MIVEGSVCDSTEVGVSVAGGRTAGRTVNVAAAPQSLRLPVRLIDRSPIMYDFATTDLVRVLGADLRSNFEGIAGVASPYPTKASDVTVATLRMRGVDTELVKRAQHGDREAFGLVAADLATRFLAVSRRILRDIDLAEDATQQALVAVWRDLPQLRDPARFDAWSYRLLVRACYAEGRRSRAWSPNLRILPADEPSDSGGVDAIIARDQLETAIRRLSVDHRTVLVLHHYADLPIERVAQILEIPIGTVYSRLHHAMRAMRAALDADARPAAAEAIR